MTLRDILTIAGLPDKSQAYFVDLRNHAMTSLVSPAIEGSVEGYSIIIEDVAYMKPVLAMCSIDSVAVWRSYLSDVPIQAIDSIKTAIIGRFEFESNISDLDTGQPIGSMYTAVGPNVTLECTSDGLLLPDGTLKEGVLQNNEGSGAGGVPFWVWIIVAVASAAVIAIAIGSVYYYQHKRGASPQQLLRAPSAFKSTAITTTATTSSSSPDTSSMLWKTRFGTIDNLEVGEFVGRGSQGKVWKARWRESTVALKISEYRVSPGTVHDICKEEPLFTAAVSHPAVLSTFRTALFKQNQNPHHDIEEGTGDSYGYDYLTSLVTTGVAVEPVSLLTPLEEGLYEMHQVSEWCDMGSLDSLLQNKPYSSTLALILTLTDIASGLAYLHSLRLVHGDLKPQNILLKSSRSDPRGYACKICDFGLSKILSMGETHQSTTAFGTPTHAAPERIGRGQLSRATDVYAFGIICWQLAAAPNEVYGGMSALHIMVGVTQGTLRPPIPEGCDFPDWLLNLMKICWDDDPQKRPSMAIVLEECKQQLNRYRKCKSGF